MQRWLTTAKIPEAMYQLLDLLLNGSIARIHGAWSGWNIDTKTGDLVTPVGTTIKPGEVMSIPYRMQLLRHLQREIAELKKAATPAIDQIQQS